MTGSTTLHDTLAAEGPAVSARVIEDMYGSPFWLARFGDRGRRHAGRDGDFHIQYLCEAVASGDAGVFVSYARWLREVLVTRGMCSRHLADNFVRLAAAIEREAWPGRERAVEILRAGAASLAYTDGAAALVERVRPAEDDDLDHFLSYLADATALGRPELFEQHVSFMAGFYLQEGQPISHLASRLAALDAMLGRDTEAARTLARVRERLEGR
jgi:hypothetical protein